MKLCLDLCSGSGGFSSAFRSSEKWEVIMVDINPRYRPDMVLDLIDAVENRQDHPDFWNMHPDVILASPPCERWSVANSHWPQSGIYQASRVLGAVLEIIAAMQPKGWIIENPRGRMRWFLGKPSMTIGLNQFGYKTVKPTDFWTNIDVGLLRDTNIRRNPSGSDWSYDAPRNPADRARMPYRLSEKILESYEEASK